jgi:hypothetical protein
MLTVGLGSPIAGGRSHRMSGQPTCREPASSRDNRKTTPGTPVMMSRLGKVLLGIRNRWRYGDVDDSGNNVLGDAKPPE